MIDLILIIILIISLFKPDILLPKKIKEKANDEQKTILTKDLRKIYSIIVFTFESIAITRFNQGVGLILMIVSLILFFVICIGPIIVLDPCIS